METRTLGNSDLRVSRICMGCMGFGDPRRGQHAWTLDEEHSRQILRRGLELGVNFFDTAIAYQSGTSEQYLGRALRDFARRKHVSSAYLCKVLKEATGKNCTALLQERRIEKAKRMLRETDLSVMEICAAVGYSNSSYFYRIFESATGMSPSAWRVNSGCDERR